MNHQGSLIGKIALWIIAALGIIFFLMIYSGNETGIDGGLFLTYAAFILGAGMVLLFAVLQIFTAGRRALPTLIGIGAFLVLLAISYALASGDVRPEWNITSSTSKWIGAGITMTGIAAAAAVLAILYGEISRMFK